MKERPILFSAPMVRPILEGRKTQTRRFVKFPRFIVSERDQQELVEAINRSKTKAVVEYGPCDGVKNRYACPYGQPGDRLWVREAFKHAATEWNGAEPDIHRHRISYLADGAEIAHSRPAGDWSGLPNFKDESYWDRRSIPSIHMPRWASRILLEVTGVRVERLKDISHEDAMAEGMAWDDAVYDYSQLWESINGKGSWDANPWVWVVEFKRLKGGAA